MSRLEMGLLLFFILLIIILYTKSNVEQFATMRVQDEDDFYPLKGVKTLNSKNAKEVREDTKIEVETNATYRQETNNKRNWKEPDNGSCVPSDMCNIMYDGIDIKENVTPLPPDYFNQNRINFYTYDVENSV